jgi:hypothetical protein
VALLAGDTSSLALLADTGELGAWGGAAPAGRRAAGSPAPHPVDDHDVTPVPRVRHCPGRKPPFWAVRRPARPYKSPIQNVFS